MAAERFESCTFKGTYVLVTFTDSPTLVVGNVYSFTNVLGCYKYVEFDADADPDTEYTDVTIENDYLCNSCNACTVDDQLPPEPPCPPTGRIVSPGYSVPTCKR